MAIYSEADYQNDIEQIKTILSDEFGIGTSQITKELLQEISNELQIYLDTLNQFQSSFIAVSQETINKYEPLHPEKNTIEYALFKQLHDKYEDIVIDDLLKKGEIIIDKMRQLFTREEIKYQIGISYKGFLFETNLNLTQLLSLSKATFNTKSKLNNIFKLRISASSKKDFLQALINTGATIDGQLASSNTLYSAIQRYLHGGTARQKNEGNAYEVYRTLLAERHYDNIPPAPEVTTEEIANKFETVRSNIAASTKGGDYMNIQIKYFSSAPSLATLNTIRTTLTSILEDINNYLSTQDATAFSQDIKKLFTKELGSAATEIENEAIQLAQDNIDEIISNIK